MYASIPLIVCLALATPAKEQVEIGEAYVKRGKPKAALVQLKKALKKDIDNKLKARALTAMGTA